MARGRYSRDAEHFVVVTPFEYGGRDFREGEAFPWRDLGLVEYQRRLLWVANKIDVTTAPTPAALAPPPAKAKAKRPAAEA